MRVDIIQVRNFELGACSSFSIEFLKSFGGVSLLFDLPEVKFVQDQHTSEKSFRSFVPERVGAATLDAAFAWRSSAVDSTITTDALTCGDVLGFGGFRLDDSS